MKRLPMTICIGLFVAAMAAPSFAADLPRPAYKSPIYTAPGFSWTGFYIGANGGYGWGWSEWNNPGMSQGIDVKGGVAGATIGYNFQTGAFVWGVEGDFDASWIKGSANTSGGICGGVGCETSNTWLGTGRGRIGYAFDRWLPYLTGGAAFGNIKMTPAGGTSESATKVGWTAGAGIEYAIWNNWSTKLEYLYADLGTVTCGAASCGVDTEVKFKTSIVRLGVNYRF